MIINIKKRKKGERLVSFKEVWDGKNDDPSNDFAYAFGNIMIGSIIVLLIVLIIKWIDEGRI